MYLKLFGYRVPPGDRLETFDVAPMPKFALRVASYDVVIEDFRHPKRLLGVGALLAYRRDYQ